MTSPTFIHMTEANFDAAYPLVTNHLDLNASWNGHLFETSGAELDFVRKQPANTIWTVMDDDNGNLCLSSGYHFVNRVGYLLSSTPFPDDTAIFVELDVVDEDNDDASDRSLNIPPSGDAA